MRIAFIGTGALGGYFGGRLAKAGNDVVFIARGAMLEALRKDGLRIESPLGDFVLPKVQAKKLQISRSLLRQFKLVRLMAAHAWTGGFMSPKFHSYAGTCPLPCIYSSEALG
jgi:UDP-glucose 6-dehydrogenase